MISWNWKPVGVDCGEDDQKGFAPECVAAAMQLARICEPVVFRVLNIAPRYPNSAISEFAAFINATEVISVPLIKRAMASRMEHGIARNDVVSCFSKLLQVLHAEERMYIHGTYTVKCDCGTKLTTKWSHTFFSATIAAQARIICYKCLSVNPAAVNIISVSDYLGVLDDGADLYPLSSFHGMCHGREFREQLHAVATVKIDSSNHIVARVDNVRRKYSEIWITCGKNVRQDNSRNAMMPSSRATHDRRVMAIIM